jgi:xylulokinase
MGFYLGFDSSTQSMKAIIIDAENGGIIASEAVNFGEDLPQFNCPDGFLENPDPLFKHSNPLMWLAALDLVLEKLKSKAAPLDKVKAISGSGQQHGSVYLKENFESVLSLLDPSQNLQEQIAPTLSRKTSPIWMDSSTEKECEEITNAIRERLQKETGSPAIERFTGPQIRKFYKQSPENYEQTKTIHLVSSFLASVLCGESAPIDYGDGGGMNLMNLATLQWDKEIAEATARGLIDKLPPIKPSNSIAGKLHKYFEKYGLKSGIPVVTWSGDNPNSLIGTGADKPGVAVISLGTSDTFFAAMDSYKVDPDGCGHVFGNPACGFMSLICFKNGSLARERVKDECNVDWNFFDNETAKKTAPGNNGNIMLPYFVSEITPPVLKAGAIKKGSEDFVNGSAPAPVKIRAVMESQALSMKLHSEWIGKDFTHIRVTGGASKSSILCQILADVFQAKLEKISIPDSAGLGAAMRAANAVGNFSFDELTAKFATPNETVEANPANKEIYKKLLEDYRKLERKARQ